MKNNHIVWDDRYVKREEKNCLNNHKSGLVWFTGLSASGKSAIAYLKGVKIMTSASKVKDEIKEIKDLLISDILPKVMESSKRKSVLVHSLHNPLLKLKEPLVAHLESD